MITVAVVENHDLPTRMPTLPLVTFTRVYVLVSRRGMLRSITFALRPHRDSRRDYASRWW